MNLDITDKKTAIVSYEVDGYWSSKSLQKKIIPSNRIVYGAITPSTPLSTDNPHPPKKSTLFFKKFNFFTFFQAMLGIR